MPFSCHIKVKKKKIMGLNNSGGEGGFLNTLTSHQQFDRVSTQDLNFITYSLLKGKYKQSLRNSRSGRKKVCATPTKHSVPCVHVRCAQCSHREAESSQTEMSECSKAIYGLLDSEGLSGLKRSICRLLPRTFHPQKTYS